MTDLHHDHWTEMPRTPFMVVVATLYVRKLFEGLHLAEEVITRAENAVRELATEAVERGSGREMSVHVEVWPTAGQAHLSVLDDTTRGREMQRQRAITWEPK